MQTTVFEFLIFFRSLLAQLGIEKLRSGPPVFKYRIRHGAPAGARFAMLDVTVLVTDPCEWGDRVRIFAEADTEDAPDGVILACLADVSQGGRPLEERLIISVLDHDMSDFSSFVVDLDTFKVVSDIEIYKYVPSLMECLELPPH